MPETNRTIISLFSGALGLDLGLEQAGFTIRAAVECNRAALATLRHNRPHLPIIDRKNRDGEHGGDPEKSRPTQG